GRPFARRRAEGARLPDPGAAPGQRGTGGPRRLRQGLCRARRPRKSAPPPRAGAQTGCHEPGGAGAGPDAGQGEQMIGSRMPGSAVLLSILIAAVALPAGGARPARAEELSPDRGYALLSGLMSEQTRERKAAAEALIAAGDRSLIPGLVDALFFIPKTRRGESFEVLSRLSGEKAPPLYLDWVEKVGAHPEWQPKAGYATWKA